MAAIALESKVSTDETPTSCRDHTILLVNPPYIDAIYDFKQEFSVEYPLGLAFLAGMLEAENLSHGVLDANAHGYTIPSTVQKIKELNPKVLGLTTTTTTVNLCAKIAKMCKEIMPELQVVIGGPHCAALPLRTLEDYPEFDYVVQGDGELALADLLHTLNKGQRIEDDKVLWEEKKTQGGIWFRGKSGETLHYDTIRQFEHLDVIPRPSRKKFPNERYTMGPLMNAGYKGVQIAKLAGSRGCPFACVFCSEGKAWPAYRARTPEDIFKEIEELYYNEGTRHFFFVDDTINVRKKDLFVLCKLIIDSGMKIKWHCYARVHPLDDEMLIAMKKSGCFGIMFGIESGDPELIKKLGKNITVDQARNAVALSKKHGLKTLSFFMFGLPGDNPTTCENTIQFAKDINPDLAFFSMTVPYPGTKLWDDYVANGVIEPKKFAWDSFTQHKRDSKHFTGSLSGDQVVHYYQRAHREFYIRPRYWGQVVKRISANPREMSDYWWLVKEFFYTYDWIPSPVNPGSRARA